MDSPLWYLKVTDDEGFLRGKRTVLSAGLLK